MNGNVKDVASLHETPRATFGWEQEKEEEEGEEEEEECGEEAGGHGSLSRGWQVIVAGFVINILSSAGSNCFGVLFSPRLLELGSSPALVAGLANVSLAASYLLCLTVVPLLHRWGCRYLLLAVGLVCSASFAAAALSFSMQRSFAAAAVVAGSCRQVVFVVVQVAVSRCFQRRRRPLAIGLTVAGSSVSQIVIPPLVVFMQSHYSLRAALLMTSVLTLHICVAAPLMPSDRESSGLQGMNYLAIVRRRDVALMCLVLALNNATVSIFGVTVPLALLDAGRSSHETALYLSASGAAILVARVWVGTLLCYFRQPITVVRLASALTAATIPVWYWCERLVWRTAWFCVCGASSGVVSGLVSLVVLEVVELKWQAEALSLVSLSTGIATLLVGEIVELARVVTGNYASKLHAISCLLALSQVLWELLDAEVRGALPRPARSRLIIEEVEDAPEYRKARLKPFI